MEKSVFDITLDLQRSCSVPEITVQRGDTHRTLRFFLADGGKPYDLTGVRAVLTAQKPDGSHLFNECTVVDDRICYDLTSQTTSCPGQVECQLRLYGENNALLSTAAFTLTVEDTVYTEGDESIESTDEATALTKLLNQTQQKLIQVSEALESIAPLQKTYELIEEVTLTEAVASFKRTTDTKGVPYDFSAIKVVARFTAAESNAQVLFWAKNASDGYTYYHTGQSGTIGTVARVSCITAYNDHGMRYYSAVNKTSDSSPNVSYQIVPSYADGWWKNVTSIGITPTSATIPAGTKISIYGIRG